MSDHYNYGSDSITAGNTFFFRTKKVSSAYCTYALMSQNNSMDRCVFIKSVHFLMNRMKLYDINNGQSLKQYNLIYII